MFSLSGIILNHRSLFSGIDISRSVLPHWYKYSNWNGGLMRGTVPYESSILIYGSNGIWQTDSLGTTVKDFNNGLPKGADRRNIRRIVKTGDTLIAASQFGVYIYNKGIWNKIEIDGHEGERITDVALRGDSLIVLSRSFVYTATAPYTSFQKLQLATPDGYQPKVTLFKTVWQLHSGELFGMAGKLVVDAIALVFIFLCLTGFFYWLISKIKKRNFQPSTFNFQLRKASTFCFKWHDKLGRWTIVLTLLLCITGWCLRPPLMVPLAVTKTKPVPGTTLASKNKWNDKLRMIAYDKEFGDWVVSTSEGFYSFKTLGDVPLKLEGTPPVSVMGINVFQKDNHGDWLVGSFSGMYVWDRSEAIVLDYYTNEFPIGGHAIAVAQQAVSGYTSDFPKGASPVGYAEGTDIVAQPEELSTLPMSLWNVALELHTGRLYIGSSATMFFVFIAGFFALWCLLSGWKVRKR